MTMETGTILTALFFLLLCSIPFILMNVSHRKRLRQSQQLLRHEADKFQLAISRFDTWGNNAIGIDEKKGVVFFIKKTADGEITQRVTLANAGRCRVANIKRTETDGDQQYHITERLDLVFEINNGSKQETAFSFFDIQHDGGMLTGELQMAEKWCHLLKDKMAKR